MNIEKAIEILDDLLKRTDPELAGDNYDAIKLGIEALKHIKDFRLTVDGEPIYRLPGETDEAQEIQL
ncbi:unnamed protein product [marine sediment metagenome]|uniref:Uncharacterized protein n=1 Tax=marine sediment metagenome TaxID=412755 RepID=X1LNB4_9ZZZZ